MDNLLSALSALPTAVYTCLMIVALFYWLSVIVGGLGFGGAEAGSDVGGHDAGGHDAGHDGHDGHHGGHGVVNFLSLGKVPIIITLSFTVFIAWALCLLVATPVMRAIDQRWLGMLVGTAIGVGCGLAGLIAAGYAVRPLRRIFAPEPLLTPLDLVGRLVRVTSTTVDAGFGTAVYENGSTNVIIDVVCNDGHRFAKHDQALVVSHDSERGRYLIAPWRGLDAATGSAFDDGRPPTEKPLAEPAMPSALSSPADTTARRAQRQ